MAESYEAPDEDQGISDAARTARLEENKKELRQQELAELGALLNHPQLGYAMRAFVWRLLSETELYKVNAYIDNTAFFENGRKSIGSWILQEVLTAEPNVYTLMRNEAVSRDTEFAKLVNGDQGKG